MIDAPVPRHKPGLMTGVLRLLVVLSLSSSQVLFGEERGPSGLPATDFVQTSWSERDGLTAGAVYGLSQTADRYLWLATDAGLVRFDGSRFRIWNEASRAPLPDGVALSVLTARDGALWVGFWGGGGVSRLDGRSVRTFGPAEGLDSNGVTSLYEDAEHTVWASTRSGLFHLEGEQWHRLSEHDGLPAGVVHGCFKDRKGNLWVGTGSGLFFRAQGATPFTLVDGRSSGNIRFAEDAFGRLWRTDDETGLRLLEPGANVTVTMNSLTGAGTHILTDRLGNLWVATIGQGLWLATVTEHAVHVDRVTGPDMGRSQVRALLEDDAGNIWIGSTAGLQQLSRRRVRTIEDVGSVRTIESTSDGSVWLGTSTGLIRLDGPRRQAFGPRDGLPGPLINTIHVDRAGTLWVATSGGLARWRDGSFVPIPTRDNSRLGQIYALTSDETHLWGCNEGVGLFVWDGTELSRVLAGSPVDACLTVFGSVDRTAVWVAIRGGGLVKVVEKQIAVSIREVMGAARLAVYVLRDTPDGKVVVGGSTGLRVFSPGIPPHLDGHLLPRVSVRSLLTDQLGGMWLGTSIGLVHFKRPGLAPRFDLKPDESYELLDDSDGVAGVSIGGYSPTAAVQKDGALWFATAKGVTVVLPQTAAASTGSLPVAIDEMIVDGQLVNLDAGLTLPSRTRTVQIGYSAVSFAAPGKTRFAYNLHGLSTEWVNADNKREAVFTNLAPGSYRFQVRAIDTRGVESYSPIMVFAVAPTFYQTWLFYALLAGGSAGLLVLAWRARLARLRREFAMVLGERIRVSRETHDTVLQSLIGVCLRLDVLTDHVDDPATMRDSLIRTREQVERYIGETRQWISNLRSTRLEVAGLPGAVRSVGVGACADTGIVIRTDVVGEPSLLCSETEQQLLRIAEEAIANAVRHARCTTIAVTLDYRAGGVRLTIADNGSGFDTGAGTHPAATAYGLRTMRERAEEIDGVLHIASSATGTVVTVTVTDGRAGVLTSWLQRRARIGRATRSGHG